MYETERDTYMLTRLRKAVEQDCMGLATEQTETRESLIQLKVNLSPFDITEDNDNIKDNKKDIANTPYRPVLTGLMNTQRR